MTTDKAVCAGWQRGPSAARFPIRNAHGSRAHARGSGRERFLLPFRLTYVRLYCTSASRHQQLCPGPSGCSGRTIGQLFFPILVILSSRSHDQRPFLVRHRPIPRRAKNRTSTPSESGHVALRGSLYRTWLTADFDSLLGLQKPNIRHTSFESVTRPAQPMSSSTKDSSAVLLPSEATRAKTRAL